MIKTGHGACFPSATGKRLMTRVPAKSASCEVIKDENSGAERLSEKGGGKGETK